MTFQEWLTLDGNDLVRWYGEVLPPRHAVPPLIIRMQFYGAYLAGVAHGARGEEGRRRLQGPWRYRVRRHVAQAKRGLLARWWKAGTR